MRKKSVWLHNPSGNPKKVLFSVTGTEVSLGETVLPASEVASCKRTYAKPFYGKINLLITFALIGWFLYEALNFLIRFQFALLSELSSDTKKEETNGLKMDFLKFFHLRTSTTDDQQMQLFFMLYISILIYQNLISHIIFRPRILLTSKNGSVTEVPYLLVRPAKFAKCLGVARKIAKKNRKAK
jgi:hypothetical protein